MSEALRWLQPRLTDAPEHLTQRMITALAETEAAPAIHDHLAEAALLCLKTSLGVSDRHEQAMQLLAADALLTHAGEAAMEQGSQALAQFTKTWNATRFEGLLK